MRRLIRIKELILNEQYLNKYEKKLKKKVKTKINKLKL
jgi:hypothetical protein